MNLVNIASDNGLSPNRHQDIIWTNAGIFLTWPLGTNLIEISIKMQIFSFTKCICKCRLQNGRHCGQGRWVKLHSLPTSLRPDNLIIINGAAKTKNRRIFKLNTDRKWYLTHKITISEKHFTSINDELCPWYIYFPQNTLYRSRLMESVTALAANCNTKRCLECVPDWEFCVIDCVSPNWCKNWWFQADFSP